MLRLRFFLLPLSVAGAVALAACASVKPIAYTPQPARVADPRAEVKNIVLANTLQGCVSEPDVGETLVVVKFACAGDGESVIGNAVLRLDAVESISMQYDGEWYGVRVRHTGGAEDFMWTSRSRADMERLADAIAALSSPKPAPSSERADGASSL